MEIKKQFVVDDKNQKVAVQIDIETFKKIEDLLENHILAQMMKESAEDELYDIQGLVAQGRTIWETLEIARDVARKLLENRKSQSKKCCFLAN